MRGRFVEFSFPLGKQDLTVIGAFTKRRWSDEGRYDIEYEAILYKKDDILPLLEAERNEFGSSRLLDMIDEMADLECYKIINHAH